MKWIVDAWDELSKDLIIKSFKGYGLTNDLDGSEDCKIHCFRSDGPIQTGQELLKQAWINADISGTRELTGIQQLDINAESNENDEDSDASLDFYQ